MMMPPAMMIWGQLRRRAPLSAGGVCTEIGAGSIAAIVAELRRETDTYNRNVPSELTQSHRVLGLDVGSKTIGMAVSDLLGITAQGLQTYRRQNKRLDFEALEKVIREYEVGEIVVGYPLRLSGATGTQSEKMSLFA